MTSTLFAAPLPAIDHASTITDSTVDSTVDSTAHDPELCLTCRHLLSAHDTTSVRWCAVTERGVGTRDCICQGVESSARVARHY